MNTSHRNVVVSELPEGISAFDVLQALPGQEHTSLLESTGHGSVLGRYSFFCTNPFFAFSSKRTECFAGPPGKQEKLKGDPFVELDALLKRFRYAPEWRTGLPPFMGGAVGYFGYELLYLIENIHDLGRDDLPVPDCQLFFYDTIVAQDLQLGKTWCIANGFGATPEEAKLAANERHASMLQRLKSVRPSVRTNAFLRKRRAEKLAARGRLTDEALAAAGIVPVLDHAHYVDLVKQAKEEIFAGNIFEVCTSNRFDTTFAGTALDLYAILRAVNHAPFAAYLSLDGVEVVSSSPERFLSLDRDRWAETRPMKGTRPRGKTPEEDEEYIVDLATDKKSEAENIMIVDLARNDLGRVCQFQTLEVPQLRIIETYPFTHQMVSTVRGRLVDGIDIVDLIRATFPGGSMTGAPKVEALKIIDRLEPVKRGIFSGSIGYIDFEGAMDLNIVIRTMIKKGPKLSFHVGGAIVADSDPEEEHQETLDKAHALVVALELAAEREQP